MSAAWVSVIVFACVYGGALLGFALRRRIPPDSLDADTKEVLKVATGLVGTMAALVLGLLVASAKSSYDKQKQDLTQVCADIALVDRALAHYGPPASGTRQLLRTLVERAFGQLWKHNSEPPSTAGEAFYDSVDRLEPGTDQQRTLKAYISQLTIGLGHTRWLMHTQSGSSISTPLLVVVVFWLTIIFVSFGLYARPNATVHAALFVCALSVAAAILLILEMDHPFEGLIRISDAPLRDVLSRLGRD